MDKCSVPKRQTPIDRVRTSAAKISLTTILDTHTHTMAPTTHGPDTSLVTQYDNKLPHRDRDCHNLIRWRRPSSFEGLGFWQPSNLVFIGPMWAPSRSPALPRTLSSASGSSSLSSCTNDGLYSDAAPAGGAQVTQASPPAVEQQSCDKQQSALSGACPDAASCEELHELLLRQAELRPRCQYLHFHQQNDGDSLTPHMRLLVVSWMVEVVEELGLHSTLHLAVALLDKFLSVTQGVPSVALQMMSVACILVAGKLQETRTRLVQQLVHVGANSFEAHDLLRGENILLSALKFRLQLPTSDHFLYLYAQMLPAVDPLVVCTALFFMELALLDYSMLAFSPSCIAAAALTLSMLCHGQRVECSHMLTELSGSRRSHMRRCAQELLRLHAAAAWPVSAEAKALLQPVCLKFGSRRWYRAAHTPPLPALPYELFRE